MPDLARMEDAHRVRGARLEWRPICHPGSAARETPSSRGRVECRSSLFGTLVFTVSAPFSREYKRSTPPYEGGFEARFGGDDGPRGERARARGSALRRGCIEYSRPRYSRFRGFRSFSSVRRIVICERTSSQPINFGSTAFIEDSRVTYRSGRAGMTCWQMQRPMTDPAVVGSGGPHRSRNGRLLRLTATSGYQVEAALP